MWGVLTADRFFIELSILSLLKKLFYDSGEYSSTSDGSGLGSVRGYSFQDIWKKNVTL